MKYFKFAQVSADTGISWVIAQPVTGPKMPDLPGLVITAGLAHEKEFYVGTADDSAVADPGNYIFEITFEQYGKELKDTVNHTIGQWKHELVEDERGVRNGLLGKYHDTASLAGIYKYDQAKALVADSTAAAPDVRAEAVVRGVTPLALANRIITNHENFRALELKIAGIRGKITDRLEGFVFNDSEPVDSFNEFFSTEKIGTFKRPDLSTGGLVEVDVDQMIGKYHPSLSIRLKYA